ncbi:hypothetical protein O5O45_00105 [Hahella aquimaris]|uniref:hypothetical protein n=1 Tax=Hahella sp. HNIBRBA332 TaxID=3015983 RepID=UPI00273B28CA|nr:hypothetical protein [Hahella sp. HNIBRBA332]WLQ14342.1 hypothetical protein O5O45_00105 [Hahella sp. HNIBRBA332]
MNAIQEIANDFSSGNVRFHKREESDLFRDALQACAERCFSTSANLCASLYEKIFTTRLVNETANPSGFSPSKDNLDEQLTKLLNREIEVIETQKLSFRQITKELVDAGVLTAAEKADYDTFYTTVRNPVAHGLTIRLFERVLGRVPAHTFEIDSNYERIFEKTAEELIQKIYEIMTIKVLRKQ